MGVDAAGPMGQVGLMVHPGMGFGAEGAAAAAEPPAVGVFLEEVAGLDDQVGVYVAVVTVWGYARTWYAACPSCSSLCLIPCFRGVAGTVVECCFGEAEERPSQNDKEIEHKFQVLRVGLQQC